MTVAGMVLVVVLWVAALVGLVLEGVLRSKERDEANRRAAGGMFYGEGGR